MDRYQGPEWRWDRATGVVGGRYELSRSKDDSSVHRVVKMLRILRNGSGDEEAARRRYPAEYEAYLIHTRREERGKRWMLRAGILARRTSEALAEYLGIAPATVTAYEKLFFDVRDKLDHSGYIATQVFEVRARRGCDNVDRAISRWLERIAYHQGWDAARIIWEASKPTLEPSTFLRETFVDAIFTKAIDELRRAHTERRAHVETVDAAVEVLRREIDSGALTRDTELERAMKGLIDSINVRVRDPRVPLPAEEPRAQPVDLTKPVQKSGPGERPETAGA